MGHSQHRDLDSNLIGYHQLVFPEKLVSGYRCRLTIRAFSLNNVGLPVSHNALNHDAHAGQWRIATFQLR